jgi:hypothetical protein
MFVVAILVAMFPNQLPSQAVKEMAASIVHLARGVTIREPVDPKLSRTGVLFQLYYVLVLQKRRFLRLLFCFFLCTDHYFCFFSSSFCMLYSYSLFLPICLVHHDVTFLSFFLLFHFPLFILLLPVFSIYRFLFLCLLLSTSSFAPIIFLCIPVVFRSLSCSSRDT